MAEQLNDSFYLAPFQGITDAIYRTSYHKYFGGFDKYFAPYISGTGDVKVAKSKLKDVWPEFNLHTPTIPQFLSKDSSEILLLLEAFASLGYKEANWNLGCPFQKVAGKGRGSGLLPFPDVIRGILQEIREKALPIDLSIKMRTGYKTDRDIFPLLEIFEEFDIKEIIIHPRTGIQLYKGFASVNVFGECLNKSTHPLAWNGDIVNIESFNSLKQQFPSINLWMIGRGALSHPGLALWLKDPNLYNHLDMTEKIFNFTKDIYDATLTRTQGINQVIDRMKPIWLYLSKSFADPASAFRRIRKTTDAKAYLFAVEETLKNEVFLSPEELKGQIT